jgi:hypothetical protein
VFGVSDKHRTTSDLWLPLIEPFSLVAAEPEKGFLLHVPPNFELLVLRNFQTLSSLTDFLKPTLREEDCNPDSEGRKCSTG